MHPLVIRSMPDWLCSLPTKVGNGTSTEDVQDQVVAWWQSMAEHYAAVSHRLAFNVFIEASDIMCNGIAPSKRKCPLLSIATDAAQLNALYERIAIAVHRVTLGDSRAHPRNAATWAVGSAVAAY